MNIVHNLFRTKGGISCYFYNYCRLDQCCQGKNSYKCYYLKYKVNPSELALHFPEYKN